MAHRLRHTNGIVNTDLEYPTKYALHKSGKFLNFLSFYTISGQYLKLQFRAHLRSSHGWNTDIMGGEQLKM
jgi:hypothetical protein